MLRLDYFSRDQVKALQFLEYDLDAQDAHAEKPDMSHRVEQFVEKHAVDEDCAKLLRAQSQAVAYEVLVDFTKDLATAPQLHSDRSTFSAEVTELIERHAEESPLLDVFVDINGLSPDFARLLRPCHLVRRASGARQAMTSTTTAAVRRQQRLIL